MDAVWQAVAEELERQGSADPDEDIGMMHVLGIDGAKPGGGSYDPVALVRRYRYLLDEQDEQIREAGNPYKDRWGRFTSKDAAAAPGSPGDPKITAGSKKEFVKILGKRIGVAAGAAAISAVINKRLDRYIQGSLGPTGGSVAENVGVVVADILGSQFGLSHTASREIGKRLAPAFSKLLKMRRGSPK